MKAGQINKSVDLRLGEIECQLKEQCRADERISEDFNLPPNLSHVGTGIPPQPGAVRSTSQPDTQGEFQTLKESLSKVKLPADVKLNDSRQGIKRTDQPFMDALAKCGRYCENGIKLFCSLEAGTELKQETLDNLFLIQYAQIKYLQEEYAALLVNGQFDASTAKIFRSLQKNTSGFDQDSLRNASSSGNVIGGASDGRFYRGQIHGQTWFSWDWSRSSTWVVQRQDTGQGCVPVIC